MSLRYSAAAQDGDPRCAGRAREAPQSQPPSCPPSPSASVSSHLSLQGPADPSLNPNSNTSLLRCVTSGKTLHLSETQFPPA